MRNDRACSYLAKAGKHSDDRVRIEVIKAAAKLAGDNCAKVLLPMIADSTERVRSLALNALGQTRSPFAYQGLSSLVKAKNFADVEPAFMKELLEAFVRCGGDDALEHALEVIGRNSLFNKARLLRLQEAMVAALQFSESPAASAALEKLTADARPAIAAAARKSLKVLRRHRGVDHE
jgi:HEAT repeat protein